MGALIRNCRVISPGIDLPGAAIEIEGGRIRAIHREGGRLPRLREAFDAGGGMALPGFVDVHCHGAGGHDVTEATDEALDAVARAKLAEGVTTFCPTTLTLPGERLEETMRAVSRYVKDRGEPFAKVAGVHLEGPFLNPECAGAQNRAHVRPPDLEEVLRLHALAPVAIVTCAVEMEGGIELVRGLDAAGIVPSCGHSAATYARFRRAREAGLRHITHFCNQMRGLHHREIGLVGAGLLDPGVFVELICDRVHVVAEMIALVFRVKPAGRILLVTDSIAASGMGEGEFDLGGLAVRVSGGRGGGGREARLARDGALAGSVLPFQEGFRHAHEITGLTLRELVRTTSLNQAESLGIRGIGRIEPGAAADVVILDEGFEVKGVFVDGELRWS